MLGQRLAKLRGSRTQQEISDKLGVSRARYSHYENDRVQPDTELLQKMADIFNVSVDYLLGRDTTNPIQEEQPNLELFSQRLTKHREQKGISIEELADKVGVQDKTIQKLENVTSSVPGQKTLDKLAEVLDITRDYLLGYTSDPKGYGKGVYDTDSRDIKRAFEQNGPVMYDGIIIDDEDDKEKLELLIRQAVFMIKDQNKQDAAKRRKKSK